MNPYAYLFWLWMTFHSPAPVYQPPPLVVHWTQTMPLAPAPVVIVMPPCIVRPGLTICS